MWRIVKNVIFKFFLIIAFVISVDILFRKYVLLAPGEK